ncbi:MAG: class I tRNA ligase family protein, partial [Candidatus Vogelbacteria bacterium]|nr:class I tRNA ligase family protein [Candidatus Vogelbacteria bacterium]
CFVFYHGFVNSNGQKMSKSIGNVVGPKEIIDQYGVDAFRYFVARELPTFEDGDFTWERFKEAYNANLANGLGNLVSRVLKMSSTYNIVANSDLVTNGDKLIEKYNQGMGKYNLNMATDAIWEMISWADKSIQSNEPFKKIKSENQGEVAKAKMEIEILLGDLLLISKFLTPIMPDTAKTIEELVRENKMPETPLFLRKD